MSHWAAKETEKQWSSIRRCEIAQVIASVWELLVDSDENLCVRDFSRASDNVLWTVFDTKGKQIGELLLPNLLEVFEAGKDYVLGRYIDPNAGVPEVRMYQLNRR